MKITFAIVVAVLGVLYQECEAASSCCLNHGFSHAKTKQHKYYGVLHKRHTPVLGKGASLHDGFDYYQYVAFGANIHRPFKLDDVCFTATCVGEFKIIAYDAHWRKLQTYKAHIDFPADSQHLYHQGTHVCLSHPQYQVYYTYPICQPRVRFVRIFVKPKKFVDKTASFYYYDNAGVGAKGGKNPVYTQYNQGGALKNPVYTQYNHDVAPKAPVCKALITDAYLTGCSIFFQHVQRPHKLW